MDGLPGAAEILEEGGLGIFGEVRAPRGHAESIYIC